MSQTDDADSAPSGSFRLGEWTVEPSLNRISRGADSVQLEPRLMDLLVFLARHPGEVLSQQAIIDGVWAEEYVGEGVLRRAVASLREALGDDAMEPTHIETISKRGYRLIAEVSRLEPESAAPVEPRAEGFRPRWTHALAVAIAAVIALLVVLPPEGIWQRIRDQEADTRTPPRIVVLPFENLGPPEDEYFADGMTEELISRLAAVSDLHVISRTSAMHYKGSDRKLADIGEELGVEYVLEGSVRWDRSEEVRDRVRITPQLIRVADDTLLLSERYDRVIEDIFEVQSDIAQQVIAKLEVTLLEPERKAVEAMPTDNMDAYNAYLRGLSLAFSQDSKELERSIEMFERAVELDPNFALAFAYLSAQHSSVHNRWFDRSPERAARAKRAADRALEIDPSLPFAHGVLGWYYDRCERDFERAMEEYSIALKGAPNDSRVNAAIGFLYQRLGRWREAATALERGVQLDPQNFQYLQNLADTYSGLREHQRAANLVDRAVALAPDRVGPYLVKADIYWRWFGPSQQTRQVLEEMPDRTPDIEWYWAQQEYGERNYREALEWLGRYPRPVYRDGRQPKSLFECNCYLKLKETEQARERCEAARVYLEKALEENPDEPLIHDALGWTYALLGRKQEAIREVERAVQLASAPGRPRLLEDLAATYARVGKPDLALDNLDHVLSIPGGLTVALLETHPAWDPLRDHPRFQEILERYAEKE
jgi:serine/threonine-protein kinase